MDLEDVEDGDGDGDDSDEDELSQGGHWSARPEMHWQRRSGRRRLHSWSLVAHTVLVHTTIHPQMEPTVLSDGTHPSPSDYLYCRGQSLLDQATIPDEDNLAGG